MSPDRTRTGRAILNHPLLTIFVALAIFLGVPTGVALWIGHDKDIKLEAQQRAFVEYQVDQKVTLCEASNGSRKALQTVLDAAANPPPSGAEAISLTQLPAYSKLPPEVRLFVDQLDAGLNAQRDPEYLQAIADNYREDYPSDQDCAAIGDQTRAKLED